MSCLFSVHLFWQLRRKLLLPVSYLQWKFIRRKSKLLTRRTTRASPDSGGRQKLYRSMSRPKLLLKKGSRKHLPNEPNIILFYLLALHMWLQWHHIQVLVSVNWTKTPTSLILCKYTDSGGHLQMTWGSQLMLIPYKYYSRVENPNDFHCTASISVYKYIYVQYVQLEPT